MKDELFINNILGKLQEAKQKAAAAFSELSTEQINWKPAPESWSMAQCLQHLIESDGNYYTVLENIADGKYKKSLWQKITPLTAWWGRIFIKQLSEEVKRKLKAPRAATPSSSTLSREIVDRYQEHLDIFMDHISKCRNADLDKTILTSPFLKIVTYSLRNMLQFLSQHEHRHLNQAMRVKSNEKFPKS